MSVDGAHGLPWREEGVKNASSAVRTASMPWRSRSARALDGGMASTLVSDAVQLAGFLFVGWLLFRFTDWIYRRGLEKREPAEDGGSTERAGAPGIPASGRDDVPISPRAREDAAPDRARPRAGLRG
jgi:hypothetical protein